MDTSKIAVVTAHAQSPNASGACATHALHDKSFARPRTRRNGKTPSRIATAQAAQVAARATPQTARIEADEAARRHLARELHDSVGAELAATHFALAGVHASLPADAPPQCAEALALAVRSLNAAVEAVRHALDGLSPPHLDAGLVRALAAWTHSFGTRAGLATSFVCAADGRLARLSTESMLAIFRVAQEALANVARHARATRADMRLDCSPQHLILTITDNGIGLPRGASRAGARRSRYGIAGMRERCTAFGGTLRVGGRGAPAGTAVRARFAWDATLCVPNSHSLVHLAKGAHS
jgi:signal transduction histidine kinase